MKIRSEPNFVGRGSNQKALAVNLSQQVAQRLLLNQKMEANEE